MSRRSPRLGADCVLLGAGRQLRPRYPLGGPPRRRARELDGQRLHPVDRLDETGGHLGGTAGAPRRAASSASPRMASARTRGRHLLGAVPLRRRPRRRRGPRIGPRSPPGGRERSTRPRPRRAGGRSPRWRARRRGSGAAGRPRRRRRRACPWRALSERRGEAVGAAARPSPVPAGARPPGRARRRRRLRARPPGRARSRRAPAERDAEPRTEDEGHREHGPDPREPHAPLVRRVLDRLDVPDQHRDRASAGGEHRTGAGGQPRGSAGSRALARGKAISCPS